MSHSTTTPKLSRELGLMGLIATGVCAMMGAGINVVPIMIQRNVPGIGGHVLFAYALGVLPAILAAFAYASLGSAMPRAGGAYVYASRSLSPYLGFVASFSQWFGLSMAIGVVSYVLAPFIRDLAAAAGWDRAVEFSELPAVRLILPIVFLWGFATVNLMGNKFYERILVPLMFLMFAGGLIAIPAGFLYTHEDFVAALRIREGIEWSLPRSSPLDWTAVGAASVILFSSFIGFDSAAQAGGEARNPSRNLPIAICVSIFGIGAYYMAFTAAIYHAVPWNFVAERAMTTDLTAPGLLGYLLPAGWTLAIVLAATIALANDLPAMILSVSRLVFAWAEDGIFPPAFGEVNHRFRTPHWAIVLSAGMATVGILGNHLSGDFFLGVDLLVTAMLVNFLLMCLSLLNLPARNPALADGIRFLTRRSHQLVVGGMGAAILVVLAVLQVRKDLAVDVDHWYFHATYVYGAVLVVGTVVFWFHWRRLQAQGVDTRARFASLPPD